MKLLLPTTVGFSREQAKFWCGN